MSYSSSGMMNGNVSQASLNRLQAILDASSTDPQAFAINQAPAQAAGFLSKGIGSAGQWGQDEKAATPLVSTLAFNVTKMLGDTKSNSAEAAGIRARFGSNPVGVNFLA
jgi:hypothetical protein